MCLFTGFYVLLEYNQTVGTIIPVVINLLVAVAALALAARTPREVTAPTDPDAEPRTIDEFSPTSIYVTIALSGAGALGAEVVWTRLMGALMGSTTYVFSIILAVFLAGIAIGSAAGAWTARTVRPRIALGCCQLLLSAAIFWTCYSIAASLPYWPINPFLAATPWFTMQLDMARAIWTILPPTLLWGASFPLALAAVARDKGDSAHTVGRVYAANTVGAIIGALSVSLILVPSIGTQRTQQLILMVAALGGVAALAPFVRRSKAIGSLLMMSLILAVFLSVSIPAVPGEFIAYGRQMPTMLAQSEILETKEGINSSVAISRWPAGTVYINVNGHIEATTEVFDMALQRLAGHLPGLLHPNPKSVLAIGFGAGVSAGAFTRYPGVENIIIAEIEPVIPPMSHKYFAAQNYGVAVNPKTEIVYDDARHYLFTTPRKFDIVTSDPLAAFDKNRAALYTQEFFDAVKSHLNPGGFFTLYVPLYESDALTVQSEVATFFAAFPNATVWANTRNGEGYDMVLMGQASPLKINIDEVQARLDRPDYAPVAESLREIGFESAAGLFRTFAGQSDLNRWFGKAEITRDGNLRLMYTAGWGINSVRADSIYRDMLRYRVVPDDLFQGSPEAVQQLLVRIAGGR